MSHKPLFATGAFARLWPADAPCAERSRPYVLAATILASAMGFIDGTLVQIALPAMQREFGVDFGTLQWIANAYLLMMSALIVTGGGLGDRLGRRRVFIAGITLFTAASIACAAAPDAGLLILARIAQGVGAALLVPQSLAIIAASFPKEIRGGAIGLWSAASAVATALGPALGGFLIDLFSWRVAFWINVPFAAIAVALALTHVPESRNAQASGPLDITGAAAITVSLAGITFALTRMPTAGAGAPEVWGAILIGLAALVLFWRNEHRVAAPITPPALFNCAFTGLNLLTLALYFTLSGALFLVPYLLISVEGLSAAQTGLAMLPLGLVIGIGSRLFGRLSDEHGRRPFLIAGPVVVAAGYLVLAARPDMPGTVAGIIVVAAGMSLVVAPLTTAVMNAIPDSEAGSASGVNNAVARIAGLIAVAAVGALGVWIFTATLGPALTARGAEPETLRAILPQAARLAGVTTGGLPADQAEIVREATGAAFLFAYRVALFACAGLAGVAVLIAAGLGRDVDAGA